MKCGTEDRGFPIDDLQEMEKRMQRGNGMDGVMDEVNRKRSLGKRREGLRFLFALIAALGVMTVCSKSSPLYPFNDWVDVNCFSPSAGASCTG